jgi:hypothetical protein
MAGSRPVGVSIVTIIIVIWGVLGLIAGVVALLDFKDNVVLYSGLIMLAVSLVYLLVAKGLWGGSGGARIIVAIVTVISLASAIWTIIAIQGQQRYAGVGSAIVGVIVLAILYGKKANAFFS